MCHGYLNKFFNIERGSSKNACNKYMNVCVCVLYSVYWTKCSICVPGLFSAHNVTTIKRERKKNYLKIKRLDVYLYTSNTTVWILHQKSHPKTNNFFFFRSSKTILAFTVVSVYFMYSYCMRQCWRRTVVMLPLPASLWLLLLYKNCGKRSGSLPLQLFDEAFWQKSCTQYYSYVYDITHTIFVYEFSSTHTFLLFFARFSLKFSWLLLLFLLVNNA